MKKVIFFLALIIFGLIVVYAEMPVVNYGFLGFPFLIMVLILLWFFGLNIFFSKTDWKKQNDLNIGDFKNKYLLGFAFILIIYKPHSHFS